jgi:DNA-binding transcriptional ArsR family regulator
MNTFTILAEPARRNILDAIRANPLTVNALVDEVGMSQPVVSKHLRILREAGLVTVQPEGQRRRYHINPEPLSELDDWLEPYRQFWVKKLDDLEAHLDNTFDKG